MTAGDYYVRVGSDLTVEYDLVALEGVVIKSGQATAPDAAQAR
jgi:hypothetical protein